MTDSTVITDPTVIDTGPGGESTQYESIREYTQSPEKQKMTEPMLIDMEPGGESTQYESIREYTLTPEKQTGQLGGGLPHTKSEMKTTLDENGDSAPNGDENDMVQRLGMGQGAESLNNKEKRNSNNLVDAETAKTRREQGYGPGSGVGA